MSLIDFEDTDQAARLKRYLGVSGSADDLLLADECDSINAKAVQIMNGRNILQDTYAQVRFDGTGTEELLLPHFPIISVSEVLETVNGDFAIAAPLVAEVDYTIDPDSGMLIRLEGEWLSGRRNLRVSWEGGFEALPGDLFEALVMCIADKFTRAKQLASGQSQAEMTQEQLGGSAGRSETYRAENDQQWGIPVTALRTFQRYRNSV